MLLVLQLHLVTSSQYSKFGVDTINIFINYFINHFLWATLKVLHDNGEMITVARLNLRNRRAKKEG